MVGNAIRQRRLFRAVGTSRTVKTVAATDKPLDKCPHGYYPWGLMTEVRMMQKKYQLTNRVEEFQGHLLYQIQALRDIKTPVGTMIKKGDPGGFVESERNLDHNGNSWITPGCKVLESAMVLDDAFVGGHFTISGTSRFSDNVCVIGAGNFAGDVRLDTSVWINSADVQMSGSVRISGPVEITGYSYFCGDDIRISSHDIKLKLDYCTGTGSLSIDMRGDWSHEAIIVFDDIDFPSGSFVRDELDVVRVRDNIAINEEQPRWQPVTAIRLSDFSVCLVDNTYRGDPIDERIISDIYTACDIMRSTGRVTEAQIGTFRMEVNNLETRVSLQEPYEDIDVEYDVVR